MNGQNYNRYSYVLNNPTNLTDPTGFSHSCSEGMDKGCTGQGLSLQGFTNCSGDCASGSEKQNATQPPNGNGQVKDLSGGSKPSAKKLEKSANNGGQSIFGKFLSELDPTEFAKQVGRKLLDDFVNNNQEDSKDSNPIYRWAAKKLEGTYEKPDATSANGIVVTVVVTAGTLYSPGGAEAKAASEVSALSKAPFWSATRARTAVENAFEHWKKHANEFPELANSKQYWEAAHNFVANPPAGALVKTRANGDVLIYDAATNTFGSRAADGAPRTMFRPQDGIDYWKRQ
jgi:hypothetical protein